MKQPALPGIKLLARQSEFVRVYRTGSRKSNKYLTIYTCPVQGGGGKDFGHGKFGAPGFGANRFLPDPSSYGYGFGPGYSMGTSHTTYNTQVYTVGTLILDVFDNSTKKLIWQGIGAGTVNKDPKNRDKNIPKAIAKIMNPYPVKPVKK